MNWTVELPRTVAEDDRVSVQVEADTIEEAILFAQHKIDGRRPSVGQVYLIHTRVEVAPPTRLPLKSV